MNFSIFFAKTLDIRTYVCYNMHVIRKEMKNDMNLDDIKKTSEIFNNIAQPIATLIAAYIGSKLVTSKKSSKKKGRKK